MSFQFQINPLVSPTPQSMATGCAFELIDSTRRLSNLSVSLLQTQAVQALAELGKRAQGATLAGGSLRAKVIDDGQMAIAHERHSGIAGPTDILTFDLRQNPSDPLDTDLLIDIDEAGRQAAARGHTLESELLLYIIHGTLHCLGFDDHDDAQFTQMHALEDQVLATIGVGPVFARDDQGANP